MKTLTLKNRLHANSTIVENVFIDEYMMKANGEYVKVYLLLLRHLQSGDADLTVSKLADYLECNEKDICRAFRYWEKSGLLKVEYDENHVISGLSFGPAAEEREPAKTTVKAMTALETPVEEKAPKATSRKVSQKQMKQLYFVTEQYLGRTLSVTDIQKINFFYDSLHFSPDLIEHLIEYCVDNGNKSMRYIEKVAMSWSDDGISTVEEAKERAASYNKNTYIVLNACGIKGRGPASVELTFIRRWYDEYGFSTDIIVEACNRTILNRNQPDFKYTESILKDWYSKGVKNLTDITLLDAAHKQRKSTTPRSTTPASARRTQNFEGRSYDMTSLEQQLLNTSS